MDLLSKVYSSASDEDEDANGKAEQKPLTWRPQKRAKFEPFNQNFKPVPVFQPNIDPNPPLDGPIPGRYISKRERSTLASASMVSNPIQPPSPITPVLGTISVSDLPQNILSALRRQSNINTHLGQMPKGLSVTLDGHTKSVNAVQWSRSHAHLLASAGMDQTICIWNVWSKDNKKACMFNYHGAAVKDVKWSHHGLFVLSCGYDCSSRLIDVEKGIQSQIFKDDQVVGVVKFHPNNSNLFISGGSRGGLKLWDIRTGKVVHQYVRNLGPILDVEFTVDAKQLISSSDVSRSNISENSIIVWDVSREIPLSNQVYGEAYTCPSIRCHPSEPYFIAQSNGNYIAIFSTTHPFRLDKYRRYESHSVSGFPIKCNFNLDGSIVASGSADGYIYFYNTKTCQLNKKLKAHDQACIDPVFHPVMPNVVASCSWNGEVYVFE
nr:WD repeat-containing protein 25 [Ipomoea batatas]